APNILRIIAPQDITISVLGQHSKIGQSGRVPTVFHFRNLPGLRLEHDPQWTLIGPVPRIAFHSTHLLTHVAHAVARPRRFSSNSAFHAAPKNMITADNCIHTINPMTAASPP